MNPYALLVAVVVWALSLVAVGDWQFRAGAEHERLTWQQTKGVELETALATNSRLQTKERTAETLHAAALGAISAAYQQRLLDEQSRNAKTLAALRAGTVRLREPAGMSAAAAGGIRPPGTGTSRCDGEPTGELSRPSAEFLFGLVADADQTAEQLASCQRVVIEDRQLCGTRDE